MVPMSTSDILAALKSQPGAIAKEIGSTPVEMKQLEAQGLVRAIGSRRTGLRGRPPTEWVVADSAVTEPVSTAPVHGAPKLPEIPEALLEKLDRQHSEKERGTTSNREKLDYIESVFAGKYGQREMGDYRLLADEYNQIIRREARRNGVTL
jgi:hypothetical protein